MAQLYDAFTITPLIAVEDLGFCAKGEGGPFLSSGALTFNTDGGGLSSNHPGKRGMFVLIEAARQLRGDAPGVRVAEPQVSLAHGIGGFFSAAATMLLGEGLMDRTIPIPSSLDAPFWEGTAEGRLMIQRCPVTGRYQTYPRAHSLHADATPEWVQAAGTGRIESFTVIHRSFYTDMPAPYVLAVVRLEEGVLVTGNMPGTDPARVQIGAAVRVIFEPVGDRHVPAFALENTR